jgi:NitT/TauT family transport system substrate-binding protein
MTKFSYRYLLPVLFTLAAISLLFQYHFAVRPPIIIASSVWPGYELLYLARHEGWLPADVVLTENPSATAAMQEVVDGKVNGAALTLDEMLRLRAKGIAMTAVLVFDVSAGADMVFGKPEVSELKDLAGKRIGFEQSALGALVLCKALEAAHLEPSQVQLVPTPYDEHLEAWQSGKIDAVITFEPVASQLFARDAHVLFDSRQIPDTIIDVLAIRTDALEKNPKAAEALVAGHFKALDYWRRNPQDAAYRMAERLQLPGNQVLDAFRGLDLPDVYANRKFLSAPRRALLDAAATLSALMVKQHFIPQEDGMNDLISDDYLPREE